MNNPPTLYNKVGKGQKEKLRHSKQLDRLSVAKKVLVHRTQVRLPNYFDVVDYQTTTTVKPTARLEKLILLESVALEQRKAICSSEAHLCK